MSAIDLRPFCANKWDIRDGLHTPFRYGKWVYATNGHLAVRVPAETWVALPEADTKKCPKNIEALFGRAFDGDGEFLVLPAFAMPDACSMCGGSGELEYEYGSVDECDRCMGRGIQFTYQELGDAGYDRLYLHRLSQLPRARIRTAGPASMAALIFDGGEAVLMPMRADKKAEVQQ